MARPNGSDRRRERDEMLINASNSLAQRLACSHLRAKQSDLTTNRSSGPSCVRAPWIRRAEPAHFCAPAEESGTTITASSALREPHPGRHWRGFRWGKRLHGDGRRQRRLELLLEAARDEPVD